MIRTIRTSDIPRLKELEDGFGWEFGPDFMRGLVVVDGSDVAVGAVGAWSRAEVHMVMDKKHGTPGLRMALLKELHDGMEADLKRLGVGQVLTWFERPELFCKRLMQLGWLKSNKECWMREVR